MNANASEPPEHSGGDDQGGVYIVGSEGLAEWCRALETRIDALTREKESLLVEGEHLARRVEELTKILKALEEAFLIGRLRRGEPLPTPLAPSSPLYAKLKGFGRPAGPAPAASPATPPTDTFPKEN